MDSRGRMKSTRFFRVKVSSHHYSLAIGKRREIYSTTSGTFETPEMEATRKKGGKKETGRNRETIRESITQFQYFSICSPPPPSLRLLSTNFYHRTLLLTSPPHTPSSHSSHSPPPPNPLYTPAPPSSNSSHSPPDCPTAKTPAPPPPTPAPASAHRPDPFGPPPSCPGAPSRSRSRSRRVRCRCWRARSSWGSVCCANGAGSGCRLLVAWRGGVRRSR